MPGRCNGTARQIVVISSKTKHRNKSVFIYFFEKTQYKDLISGKKVSKYGVTFIAPTERKNEKYNNEILSIIDKYCTELVPYKQTRFEIAKRVLFPEPYVEEKKDEEE